MSRQPAVILSQAPEPRRGLLRWALPLSVAGHGAAAAAGLLLAASEPAPLPATVTVEVVAMPGAPPSAADAMAEGATRAPDRSTAAAPAQPAETPAPAGEHPKPATPAETAATAEAGTAQPSPTPPEPERRAETMLPVQAPEPPPEPAPETSPETRETPTPEQLASTEPSAGSGSARTAQRDAQQASLPSAGASAPPRYELGSGGNPVPDYPWRARRAGWEGRVVVQVEVTPDGAVADAQVADSSGHAVLDEAAVETIRRWRFEPARQGGAPVAGDVRVPITFRLVD